MPPAPVFVLVHSPLVGPATWTSTAQSLQDLGAHSVVLTLEDVEGSHVPYWQQHAEAARRQLEAMPLDRPLVLVGHSGAGPRLPAIRSVVPHRVVGYIFVDAALPHPGLSVLEEMEASDREFATEVRRHLEVGSRYPTWTDEDLRDLIPDARVRHALLSELHPRALDYFTETMPDVHGWPDAPCGYIRFSEVYSGPAEDAEARGWPVRTFDGGHFHMLVVPGATAEALVALQGAMQSETD